MLAILKPDVAVQAIFLKGSLARDEADADSDVDFYCLIESKHMDAFLERRWSILAQYRPILYRAEANFVGPQAVVVYDNGLHFDLFAVTLEKFPTTEPIKVLHDPDHLLDDYTAEPLTITLEDVLRHFDYFAFTLIEVKAAINRGNLLWARALLARMSTDIAFVYRYRFDPAHAQLAMRHIDRVLDPKTKAQLERARHAPIHEAALISIDTMRDIARQYPDDTPFNWVFFDYMHVQIKSLG